MNVERIWECTIGGDMDALLPYGADEPMRQAVEAAYTKLTGKRPKFTFSGWGATLNEADRAVVEDRLPDRQAVITECRAEIARLQKIIGEDA